MQSFDNYFVNQIYSSLRIRDMRALFSYEWENVTTTIDTWINSDNNSKDFIDYLDSRDMDYFSNNTFLRYAEMVAYIASKLPNSRAYWLFLRIIYNDNLKGYDKKYDLDLGLYKNCLLDIVKNSDVQLMLITNIHFEYKTLKLKEDEELIKDDDIWPFIKEKFIQTTKKTALNEDNLLNWLYRCVDNMEETSRKLCLDKDCLDAYRKRVEDNPSYYIKTFVRLGMVSSSPDWNSVACEPFWRQIFGDEFQFEIFLNKCKENGIEKSDLVWNFWQLYKANEFEPISYENQGPVQDKIDNNLVEEVRKLEEMRLIEDKVSQIPQIIDSVSKEEKEQYKQLLINKKNELDNIKLYISFTGSLKRLINEKLKILE